VRRPASLTCSAGAACCRGASVAVAAVLISYLHGGSPDLEVWQPLNEQWAGDDCEIPPEDATFFDVDGKPFSVDRNHSTREWFGETSCTARCPASVLSRATRITRAQFDVLRWRAGSARRERAEQQELADRRQEARAVLNG